MMLRSSRLSTRSEGKVERGFQHLARLKRSTGVRMRRLTGFVLLLLLLVIAMPHDTLRASAVERLSVRYHYNLLAWEVTNFPAKWLRWLGNVMVPFRQAAGYGEETVLEYFRLKREAGVLREELNRAVATESGDLSDTERRLEALLGQVGALRPRVEQALEAAITDVLREEGIPLGIWRFVFPPVDLSLDRLPTMLFISPRDRIDQIESVRLVPDVPAQARETLEDSIFRQEDLSALVAGIGGLSTYPALIDSNDLRFALRSAGHEWLHNYLFFRPLGQRGRRDSNMRTIEETTADIIGDEVGNQVFARLTGEATPVEPKSTARPCPAEQFCFNREMRETRLHVDELLAEGKIEEAETYMEQRRQVFVEEGYNIRKLNQAYFAYHGTYGESPASVSPIYGQLQQVREASPSLAAFVHTLAGISSFEEFTALVQRLEEGSAEGRSPFAGSLRACPEPAEGVSLRYKNVPLPGQEGGQGDGRIGFSAPAWEQK